MRCLCMLLTSAQSRNTIRAPCQYMIPDTCCARLSVGIFRDNSRMHAKDNTISTQNANNNHATNRALRPSHTHARHNLHKRTRGTHQQDAQGCTTGQQRGSNNAAYGAHRLAGMHRNNRRGCTAAKQDGSNNAGTRPVGSREWAPTIAGDAHRAQQDQIGDAAYRTQGCTTGQQDGSNNAGTRPVGSREWTATITHA